MLHVGVKFDSMLSTRGPEHAVCLTGLERSFAEIGGNVREGVYRLLGPRVTWFGVKPPHDAWSMIHTLLPPFAAVERQATCWSAAQANETISWLHCLSHQAGRTGDCRLGFLQSLCDLQACEAAIAAHERRASMTFATVLRLRADLFWEAAWVGPAGTAAAATLPAPHPGTVHVPFQDSAGGATDKLAFGGRDAMRAYLLRLRHVAGAAQRWPHLKGKTTEAFLVAAMSADGVAIAREHAWMYCAHTKNAIVKGRSGRYGCMARVRCRLRCASLVCDSSGPKPECHCFEAPCSHVHTHTAAERGPRRDPADLRRHPPSPTTGCIDLDDTTPQLVHGCPPPAEGAAATAASKFGAPLCGGACAWPVGATAPPSCVFRSTEGEIARSARARRSVNRSGWEWQGGHGPAGSGCLVTNLKTFFAGGGNWPYAGGELERPG